MGLLAVEFQRLIDERKLADAHMADSRQALKALLSELSVEAAPMPFKLIEDVSGKITIRRDDEPEGVWEIIDGYPPQLVLTETGGGIRAVVTTYDRLVTETASFMFYFGVV